MVLNYVLTILILRKNRFNLLKIENPTTEQVGNVENLQKELRKLQKMKLAKTEKNEFDGFCKNILQVIVKVKYYNKANYYLDSRIV